MFGAVGEFPMLCNLAWQATDDLIRAQLTVFHACCDQAGAREDDRRRALGLDNASWLAWRAFLDHGPLPAEPALPEMLRRIAVTSFRLLLAAEQ
jgi:hypothetical protein